MVSILASSAVECGFDDVTSSSKPHSTALDARMLTITPPMRIPLKTTFSKPHSTALDARMLTITPSMRIPHKATFSKPHSTALDARMLTITILASSVVECGFENVVL
jgi:hypothetical protein